MDIPDQTMWQLIVEGAKWLWVTLIAAVVELFRRQAKDRASIDTIERDIEHANTQRDKVIDLLERQRESDDKHTRELIEAVTTAAREANNETNGRIASIEEHLRRNAS